MRKFPGNVEMVKNGTVHYLVLNDTQKEWLARWFPTIENCRLAKAMGISLYKLHCFAREMGLEKSDEGLKAIRRRRDIKAAQTNERNGCYDRKRGHPVSAATMAGIRRSWQEERDGTREKRFERMKREHPDRYKALIEKRRQGRRESVRKEKMRMLYGLSRQTKMTNVVLEPYRRSQICHRMNALKRGYILTEDCSEGNPDRYIIYYDHLTERSVPFERNCQKDGFSIRKWS